MQLVNAMYPREFVWDLVQSIRVMAETLKPL